MKFEEAVQIILGFEGGYVFDPHDPGGETNFGISKRAYPDVDIKSLTREHAAHLYKNDYWDILKLDKMPPEIRLMVFDCAVNQGRARAIRFLQAALGVKADGVLGPITSMAFKDTPIGAVFNGLAVLRHNHYASLPTWSRFGKGWSKRLLQIVLKSVEII